VGRWANWDHFRELERAGLMMYGQMTAGSWIYIGSQGIVQGTYETFGAVARTHFGGSLAGRFVLTAGLGGMGGAQPLAATMNGAAILGVEVDESRIDKRLATGYCDRKTASLDEALRWIDEARRSKTPLSVGLLGNAAEVLPELVRRGVTPDVLTDQTSAHDMLIGYIPKGMSLAEAPSCGNATRRRTWRSRPRRSWSMSARCSRCRSAARSRSTTATTSALSRSTRAWRDAFRIPGFVPEYIRPAVLRGEGAVPLGRALGRPEGHRADGRAGARAFSARQASSPAGSRSRGRRSTSRDCRRASAGSDSATGRSSAWR
jgi:urocanate hydratase